jgi:hypothetical protein
MESQQVVEPPPPCFRRQVRANVVYFDPNSVDRSWPHGVPAGELLPRGAKDDRHLRQGAHRHQGRRAADARHRGALLLPGLSDDGSRRRSPADAPRPWRWS